MAADDTETTGAVAELPPAATPPAPETPSGVVRIENVQLEDIEKAIYSRDYEKASQLLLVGLRRLKQGGQWIGYAPNEKLQQLLFTRLCAAIVALMSDPNYSLSQEGFDHFASEHAIIDIAFRASAFDTSDHMLPTISSNPTEQDHSKLHVANGAALVKFLLTYSLRSGFGLNFEETFRKNPQVMFSLWAGMISPLLTVAIQASERRELLLGLHEIFADVIAPDGVLATLSDAYMYTSYGVRKDKHEAKATIHRIFARMLVQRGVKLPDAALVYRRRRERTGRDVFKKPTILICIEWFGHLHAMFRCYAPIIRQLRQRFRLVGMSRASDIDAEGKAEFDEWREVKADTLNVADLVREIWTDIKPDIIYYPSLGMAMWWVILASVRLAPIQVMTLGHPASSRSPCIDYVICEQNAIGDPALFTERIVEIPSSSARFVMRPDTDGIPWGIPMEESPAVVRVAIPAMLSKLNAPFMATLREIAETPRARPARVEFHFFINMIGVNLLQATREIRDWVPNAVVHARSDYVTYMTELRKCHVHLCTFPFGGTNSNIDSMLLGIPVLAMEGNEPHERFDAMMIRHAGLPEFMVAKSREEFAAVANRLIDDDEFRTNLSKRLRKADLQGLFFGEPAPDRRHAFVDAMTRLYDEHEALQLSDERVIRIKPRSQPDGPNVVTDTELGALPT